MPISSKNTSSDKVTLCFDIQQNLAERFLSKAEERCESIDSLIDNAIAKYLETIDLNDTTLNLKNDRKFHRKKVSIPAIIELEMPLNEIQYKPVEIINISTGGVALKLNSNSIRAIENMIQKLPFTIMFSMHQESNIVKIPCKPVHVTKKSFSEIGAAFLKIPEALKNALQVQFGI